MTNDIIRNETSEEEGQSEATESKRAAGIARGRMHAALVYVIKFSEEGTDSEIAHKYCTTPGKVNDIRKNRNFKYVTEDLKFTDAEIAEAKERFAASVNGENSTVPEDAREEAIEGAHTALEALDTVEESTLSTLRKAERKPRGEKAEDDGDEPGDDEVSDEDLEGLLDD